MRSKVEFTDTVAVKTYAPEYRESFYTEWRAYRARPLFAPKLLRADPQTLRLIVDRHIPILHLPREESVLFRQPLWELLQKLHESGWWHRDVCLVNVVVNYDKPLLIDWENATLATRPQSYDLYGAARIDAPSAWDFPYSVHWFNNCPYCPDRYWRDL